MCPNFKNIAQKSVSWEIQALLACTISVVIVVFTTYYPVTLFHCNSWFIFSLYKFSYPMCSGPFYDKRQQGLWAGKAFSMLLHVWLFVSVVTQVKACLRSLDLMISNVLRICLLMAIPKFFGTRKENILSSMKVKRFVLAKSMLRSRHRARLGACFCSVKAFNLLLRKVRLGTFAFSNWQPSSMLLLPSFLNQFIISGTH